MNGGEYHSLLLVKLVTERVKIANKNNDIGIHMSDTQVVYVKSDEHGTEEGLLQFSQFSSGDRMSRALKILGLCWLGAGITLFIPLAHFVLVPGLLIAGPVLAMMKYKVDRANESVSVECPKCKKSVSIKLDAADKLPIYSYCPDCNTSLQLAEK